MMSIIDDLLADLPGDAAVDEVRVGAFWTVVSTARGAGMASTLRDAHAPNGHGLIRWAGSLTEHSALELAQLLRCEGPMEASLGMAAVNALVDSGGHEMTNRNAVDEIIRRGRSKRVAIIGHFPFIPRVREAVRHLDVLEIDPDEGELPTDSAGEVLPGADVVAITGTSLVNKTFGGLVKLCRPDAFVCVIGPTTPLSRVLFDYGVDLIAGTRVIDPKLAVLLAGQGAIFSQMRGVRLMVMERNLIQAKGGRT
ncbi:MAG: DUF364 domain-containing protein [bacterium]